MSTNCILTKLGKAIRKIRSRQGLTQEEFAKISGFHRTYIGSVERGERNISFTKVYKIAKALDTDLEDIIFCMKGY